MTYTGPRFAQYQVTSLVNGVGTTVYQQMLKY
jgi:hypothetical protein